MPLMDMMAALTDPYTIDRFTVIRRAQTVNDFGQVVVTPTTTPNVPGVVTAGQPSSLDRQPNMQVAPKWIDIVTRFVLYPESESLANTEYQPDIVVWRGNNFIVKTLADYTNYGSGFVAAGCALVDSQQVPPAEGS